MAALEVSNCFSPLSIRGTIHGQRGCINHCSGINKPELEDDDLFSCRPIKRPFSSIVSTAWTIHLTRKYINIQPNNVVDVSPIENQNERESEWKEKMIDLVCLENLLLTTLAN